MATGLLVAVGTAEFEARLLEAGSSQGMQVVRRCVDVADLVATAATRQAAVALVSTHLRDLDSDIVARLREEEVAVIGITGESSGYDATALRRFGVETVVPAEDLPRLANLVEEAVAAPLQAPAQKDRPVHQRAGDAPAQPVRRGQVVSVWGPGGAPGRSTVALGVGAELAAAGLSTLVVDGDVYGGSLAQQLGLLDESSGLLAAARSANNGHLNASRLAEHARQVNPTLRVLTGLPRADRWTEVRPVLLRSIVEAARSLTAYTVIDCGFSLEEDEEISYDTTAPRRNGATLQALELADTILVVGSADPVGLGRLVRALAELGEVVPGADRNVIVNRMRGTLGWSVDEVTTTLERTAEVGNVRVLPFDHTACDRSMVHGRTLTECAPGSKLTQAFRELAAELSGVDEGLPRRRRAAKGR